MAIKETLSISFFIDGNSFATVTYVEQNETVILGEVANQIKISKADFHEGMTQMRKFLETIKRDFSPNGAPADDWRVVLDRNNNRVRGIVKINGTDISNVKYDVSDKDFTLMVRPQKTIGFKDFSLYVNRLTEFENVAKSYES